MPDSSCCELLTLLDSLLALWKYRYRKLRRQDLGGREKAHGYTLLLNET